MTRRTLLCSTACVALALAITHVRSATVRGEQDAAATLNADIAAELKDKILLLEVNRSSVLESKSGTVLLHKVRIVKLGSRDFVIGDGYALENDDFWYKDMLVGVPCESIIRFQAMHRLSTPILRRCGKNGTRKTSSTTYRHAKHPRY